MILLKIYKTNIFMKRDRVWKQQMYSLSDLFMSVKNWWFIYFCYIQGLNVTFFKSESYLIKIQYYSIANPAFF